MSRFGLKAALIVLALFASATVFQAQEPKKADPAGDDKEVIKTKPTKGKAAASVQFRKDLNLPFPSLGTLGSRIDAARRGGDPVSLANLAAELAVAEKVAGKMSSLTSPQVMTEATELASLRRQESELKAVLGVSEKVLVAQQQVENLKKQITFAQGLAAADKRAIEKNEEPTSTPRKVVVNNYSTQYIDIQVNGYLKGQVSPGSSSVFTIDQRWSPIVLKGWGDSDETTFGPVVLQGTFTKYTWNINNDDGVPNLP